jgi:hypothetical protein
MLFLLRLVLKGKRNKCLAMLDRGEGDVNERDPMHSALATRTSMSRS